MEGRIVEDADAPGNEERDQTGRARGPWETLPGGDGRGVSREIAGRRRSRQLRGDDGGIAKLNPAANG
jgi:hypothetical protein